MTLGKICIDTRTLCPSLFSAKLVLNLSLSAFGGFESGGVFCMTIIQTRKSLTFVQILSVENGA